jgi:hypothetical protein
MSNCGLKPAVPCSLLKVGRLLIHTLVASFIVMIGLVSSIRALGGLSLNIDAKSVFDTSTFSERDFLEERHFKSDSVGGNLSVAL